MDLFDLYFLGQICSIRIFPFLESLRQCLPERCPSFDNRVVNITLSVPPQQRLDFRLFRQALLLADLRLALLIDTNDCVPAALGGNLAKLGRKALKTVERVPTTIRKKPSRLDGLWLQKAGSWHDPGVLRRYGEIWKILYTLLEDEAAMRDGLINADGVQSLLRSHLEGRGYHHIMLTRALSFLEWRRS
ncbi:MAG: hypothetical protein QME88_12415 [Actinomycetota bacterium]|nr:hypothetical protein [Actinomycetota bacterium]